MKFISAVFLIFLVTGAASSAGGQTMSKCFRADWLQGERIVKLSLDGNKVSGTFSVGDGGGAAPAATYKFSGTRRGNTLTVAFAGNKLPDVGPSEMKSLVWTLVRVGDQESLRIKFSGKNYDTNKYEVSSTDFAACAAEPGGGRESYADLLKAAQTVRFARGANAARMRLDTIAGLQAMTAPATFLINAAKSQTMEIVADGCTIEVYLPNKKLYRYVEWEAGSEKTYASTGLDRMSIEGLPLTGNYLIVLRKPNEVLEPDMLVITVKN